MITLMVEDLKKFAGYLQDKGYSVVDSSKNPYEALRCVKSRNGKDTIVIYMKGNGSLTVQKKDIPLVEDFYRTYKGLSVVRPNGFTEEDTFLMVSDILYNISMCNSTAELRKYLKGISDTKILQEVVVALVDSSRNSEDDLY